MDLEIDCQGLEFTDHSQTAPPAAIAALQRGVLNACFTVTTGIENSLQPETAIMACCGMLVQSVNEIDLIRDGEQLKIITLELARGTPEVIEVMRDVRRSTDLPFSPAAAQRLTDDSFVEHALQQQAWHAEFTYQRLCDSNDLQGPGLLSILYM